jgi:TRAP-type C4-dicarboxylate transport system substrate-binding protein
MRINRRSLFLIAFCFLGVLTCGAPADAVVVIKMATLAPRNSSWHRIIEDMAAQWKSLSGGEVELRIYPGGVAGDDRDVVRKMRLGTLNGAVLTAVGVSEIERSVYALEAPLMYSSSEEVYAVLDRMRPGLEAAIAARGFVVLNWADAGWIHFFTSRPAATPEDLRREKLFQWEGEDAADRIVRAAGFNPIPLPATELATALQTGLVTAVTVSPQVAVISQYYRHAPYMTDLKWQMLLGASVITKSTWDRVPEALRPALLQAAAVAGQRLRTESRNAYARDIAAMKGRGLTVVAVSEADRAQWIRTVDAAYPSIRGPVIPAAAFDEARRHLNEIRKRTAGPQRTSAPAPATPR